MVRRTLHKIHLWGGLILCLPLLVQGITGSILVFGRELNNNAMVHHTMAVGTPHSPSEIIEAARTVAPEGFKPNMLRMPQIENDPAVIFLRPVHKKISSGQSAMQPKQDRIQVRIDPVSLEILNKDNNAGFVHTVHELHTNLMLHEYNGRTIVGWFGVALLLFGLTGFVLWWPRPGQWKHAFIVRRKARGARLYRELHAFAGVWTMALLLVASTTGIYLAFPQTINPLFTSRDLNAPPEVKSEPIEGKEPMSIDTAVARAIQEVASGKLISVTLPVKPADAYRVAIARSGDRYGVPPVTVFIDPWSERILEVRDPAKYSVAEKFAVWYRPLHFGQGFGSFWRTLVFITGMLPPFFAVTGVSMWLIKRNRKRKNVQSKVTPKVR